MKPKLIPILIVFVGLASLLWHIRPTGSTQHVARVKSSQESESKQLRPVLDMILELESSLSFLRQMPDEIWFRNFFKPKIRLKRTASEEPATQKKKWLPRLTSILVNRHRSYAILDNQVVGEGEMIRNMRVIKIEMGKVTLQSGYQTIVLTLD